MKTNYKVNIKSFFVTCNMKKRENGRKRDKTKETVKYTAMNVFAKTCI